MIPIMSNIVTFNTKKICESFPFLYLHKASTTETYKNTGSLIVISLSTENDPILPVQYKIPGALFHKPHQPFHPKDH